jgi:hypothetical protein
MRCKQFGSDRIRYWQLWQECHLDAFEINQAIHSFYAAALMTNGKTTMIVSTTLLFKGASKDFSGVVLVISLKE